MPIYEFFCLKCCREWEAWHEIEDRENEFCCGEKARQLISLGTVRPNGIVAEQPKLARHQPFRGQIIKDGEKKIDQAVPNAVIAEANKNLDKINAKRGYRADD